MEAGWVLSIGVILSGLASCASRAFTASLQQPQNVQHFKHEVQTRPVHSERHPKMNRLAPSPAQTQHSTMYHCHVKRLKNIGKTAKTKAAAMTTTPKKIPESPH